MYKIVRIEWIDASADNTWRTASELEAEPATSPCITIGFLARKPSKKNPSYAVAATKTVELDGVEVSFVNIQTIPKAWVKKVVELDVPE